MRSPFRYSGTIIRVLRFAANPLYGEGRYVRSLRRLGHTATAAIVRACYRTHDPLGPQKLHTAVCIKAAGVRDTPCTSSPKRQFVPVPAHSWQIQAHRLVDDKGVCQWLMSREDASPLGELTFRQKQQARRETLCRVLVGRVRLSDAAIVLGIGECHARRMLAACRQHRAAQPLT
jgi:hypothetical protein